MENQKQVFIYEYDEVPGLCGKRYAIPKSQSRLVQIFDAVRLIHNGFRTINGVECVEFEMPKGFRLEDNKIIQYWIEHADVQVFPPLHTCKK